jgi:hypothetical protein
MTSTHADWSRLTDWLAERAEPMVVIPWSVLDALVGGLPDSATKHYPQWWQGDRANTRAWRRAGYELVRVDLGRTVTLTKSTPSGNSPKINRAGPHPSTAGSAGHAQVKRPGGIGLETIDPLSALILLPCSASKANGGSSRTVAPPSPSAPELQHARNRLQNAARVDERQVMPAWQRYTGGFYQSAGSSLADAMSAGAHVAILSGGYGVVRADEAIGTYDKELKPADWPGDILENALTSEAIRIGAQHVGVLRHECGSPHRSERGFLVVRQGFWAGAGGPVSCTRLATGFRGSEKMRPMRIKRPCG